MPFIKNSAFSSEGFASVEHMFHKLRARAITASDVECLFDVKPDYGEYRTKLQRATPNLALREAIETKRWELTHPDELKPPDPKKVFVFNHGHRGEAVSFNWFLRQRPHLFDPEQHLTLPEDSFEINRIWSHPEHGRKLLCAPDREIWSRPRPGEDVNEQRLAFLIEFKTPVRRPPPTEVPVQHWLQMQHQMAVCEAPFAYYVNRLPESAQVDRELLTIARVERAQEYYNERLAPFLLWCHDMMFIGKTSQFGTVPVYDPSKFEDPSFLTVRASLLERIQRDLMPATCKTLASGHLPKICSV